MNESIVITEKYKESEIIGCIITNEHIYKNDNNIIPIKAMWDTGSSGTVISSDLVKKLGLSPIGKSMVKSSGSSFKSGVYNLELLLAEKQIFRLQVTESDQLNNSDMDVLIGMDVITLGDFAISTVGEEICFSFRYPSQGFIDFKEQEIEKQGN